MFSGLILWDYTNSLFLVLSDLTTRSMDDLHLPMMFPILLPTFICSPSTLSFPLLSIIHVIIDSDSYFIPWVMVGYYHYFGPQIISDLALGTSSNWLLSSWAISPSWSGPLLLFCKEIFQVHLLSSLYQPWNRPFLQGALVPFGGVRYSETRIWMLGVFLVTGIPFYYIATGVVRSKGKKKNNSISLCVSISVLKMSSYWYLQFQPRTIGFILTFSLSTFATSFSNEKSDSKWPTFLVLEYPESSFRIVSPYDCEKQTYKQPLINHLLRCGWSLAANKKNKLWNQTAVILRRPKAPRCVRPYVSAWRY